MKNYTQVYVKDSLEAAKVYCDAFGAEIGFNILNDDKSGYTHCELNVNGEGILAIGEAEHPCDVELVHKLRYETMTFNAFELGEQQVLHAFDVLSDGGCVIHPLGSLPWSTCCATVIDKYGVCWWISA